MKFASFSTAAGASYGIASASGLIDLARRTPYRSLRAMIAANALGEAAAFANERPDFTYDEATLLPPVPDPAHIFCVGTNYLDHLKEAQDAGLDRRQNPNPSIFTRFPDTLVGHGEPLLRPKVSTHFDFETELAVIIGTGGRYIERGAAYAHVAGYTCFNDGSIRDWQFHTSQIVPGKNFWRSGSAGPWMVEAADIADPANLDIQLRLNGEVMQHSNTRHLIFDIPAIIAYVSSLVPLQPGDMIATGTPAGVGFSRKPPVFMKAGDMCEVEVAEVGILRNGVEDERG
ncbi:MAG: fumarylacetoacetate hydrolase family protein [Hyphomicrobiales bacterium]|nr:fumarylacetoacetate hydrolase family protein [Hyphomicrobiales bacterium]